MKIIKIINRYPGTKVTFLETPVYSIKNWNESKGHKDPNVFVEQDENLRVSGWMPSEYSLKL
jgi:hypothetical protein